MFSRKALLSGTRGERRMHQEDKMTSHTRDKTVLYLGRGHVEVQCLKSPEEEHSV